VFFRPGLLPNDPSKPRLKLKRYLTGAGLTPAPAAVNWDTAVASFPMYGNDQYGDCVWAMIGHAIQVFTANASTEVDVTDADVLKGYSDVTGFNPDDPSTDQGTVIQDALDYWRKTGVGGHKILAFAQVDHTDEAEMQQAAALFGAVLFGMNFPAVAMTQFNAGKPWDVVRSDGGIEGGHAILGARYDAAEGQWYIITWAKEQPVTFAFIKKYFEEAWVVATSEWVKATGQTPSGLDLATLGADFTALTGSPNPFPSNPPPPPQPPVGNLEEIVQSMARDHSVAVWVHNHHFGHAAVLQDYLKQLLASLPS
jgi:hypothetical protein